jgi:uncharacterized protein
MVDERDGEQLRAQLRVALRDAMKQRDKAAVAAFRTALGLIDNTEAADVSQAPAIEPGRIAGGVAGLGAAEVARKALTDTELVEILQEEVARWESTARDAEAVGRADDAARLRAEIDVLRPFLTE